MNAAVMPLEAKKTLLAQKTRKQLQQMMPKIASVETDVWNILKFGRRSDARHYIWAFYTHQHVPSARVGNAHNRYRYLRATVF